MATKGKNIHIRLTPDEHERLRVFAEESDMTISYLVRASAKRFIRELERADDALVEHMRNLNNDVEHRLRARAARNGRTVEEEAEVILTTALEEPPKTGKELVEGIRKLFEPLGGVELELPPDEPIGNPPKLG